MRSLTASINITFTLSYIFAIPSLAAVNQVEAQGNQLLRKATSLNAIVPPHYLAGDSVISDNECHDSASFLGVGNTTCMHENLSTAVFLLAVIIVVSIGFERMMHFTRRAIHCPQLRKIVNRIFEEVMIMGFISMVIFTLNTSGAMSKLNFNTKKLTSTEQLHIYEFFHYVVFLTMIYFILIVLLLLFIGTVVPKLVWESKEEQNFERAILDESDDCDITDERETYGYEDERTQDESDVRYFGGEANSSSQYYNTVTTHRTLGMRGRLTSGMDLVLGSKAYSLLLQRYQREGWWFRFNLFKQWHMWKSFEILAYNICQHRSGYIYKNPYEMERLFGVKVDRDPRRQRLCPKKPMTYSEFHVLCMRNLLFHITELHFSAFVILIVICLLPALYPDYDHLIFIGVGCILLLINLVIFFKVLRILRGIVDDRLRIITANDIQNRLERQSEEERIIYCCQQHQYKPRRPTLRVVALGIRAVIRMQMSALCHRQLHYHDKQFWFESPKFLLRLFQFATVGQAFYLVWLSLVEAEKVLQHNSYLMSIMILLPFIALCVITPLTMPSLVLVMSLTGIFVEMNCDQEEERGQTVPKDQTKTHIRALRHSFLKSHHSATDTVGLPPSPTHIVDRDQAPSPANMFMRMFDSPTAAERSKLGIQPLSPTRPVAPQESPSRADGGSAGVTRRTGEGNSTQSSSRGTEESGVWTTRSSYFATQSPSGNGMTGSTRTYWSPRKKAELGYNPSTNWSQAPMEIVIPPTSPRTNMPSRNGEVSANVPCSDQKPSPVGTSQFKSYCSKYGGYPDL